MYVCTCILYKSKYLRIPYKYKYVYVSKRASHSPSGLAGVA